MNRKRIILRFLCAALLLSGLGLLFYPSVNAWLERKKTERRVDSFREAVADQIPQPVLSITPAIDSVEEALPYPELLEAMEAYNKSIFADKQAAFAIPGPIKPLCLIWPNMESRTA